MTKYLGLNDISCYKEAFLLSNCVWGLVVNGIQFINAIDSISANIAEGFGRYGKKDKIKFYYYSFGSVKESLDWNEKAKVRGLLMEEEYKKIFAVLEKLPKSIHQLIKFTNEKLKQ